MFSPAHPYAGDSEVSLRPIRLWLYSVCALIAIMVVIGGVTRLTDSGLSITEWKPLLGVIPPLTEMQWLEAFEKYRQIPEYRLQNQGMTLSEFKFIYWWEWAHRFWGRLIGAAFALPLIWFALKRRIPPGLYPKLTALFLLGGLQGFIGWWMVASGLSERVDVSQYRLAVHLSFALVIFAGVLWVALGLRERPSHKGPPVLYWTVWGLFALFFVQVFAGALVAGLDAGLIYNTWPLMEGALIPEGLYTKPPGGLENAFENLRTVQFHHRMLAYALFAFAFLHFFQACLQGGKLRLTSFMVFAAITLQAVIGIATLLLVVPLWAGVLHQGFAVLVLAALTAHLRAMRL